MKKFLHQLTEPLRSIASRPWDFVGWLLVANGLGLVGFWLPILLVRVFRGGPEAASVYNSVINSGHLGVFTIVLLAESLAGLLIVVGAGSNNTAAGMRKVFGSVAFLLALIQTGIFVIADSSERPPQTPASFQILLTGLAIILASYLYCFRYPAWEKGLDEATEKEQEEVDHLGQSAQRMQSDEGGVKL